MNRSLMTRLLTVSSLLLAVVLLFGCGGGGSSSSNSTGTLSVALTDAASDSYQAIYVTIDRVDVCLATDDGAEGDWVTVAQPGETYNLLELVNGIFAQLGQEIVASGSYSQLRLLLGVTADGANNLLGVSHPFANYVIDANDAVHELKVPGGYQSGLKIVRGFVVAPGQMTELLLDFDASRSVVSTGSSGQYLLKPSIKVLNVANLADLYGTVSEQGSDPAVALANSYVSAQTVVGDALAIVAGTLATDAGEYALQLEPGSYNLVATAAGYDAGCTLVALAAGDSPLAVDFSLPTQVGGTVEVALMIAAAEGETPAATLSFIRNVSCGAATTPVIVDSESVAEGSHSFVLPAGSYTVLAESDGYENLIETLTVEAAGSASLSFSFGTP